MTSAGGQDSFQAFEDVMGQAFEAVTSALASTMTGAEVSLVATNVAAQSPDELIQHLDAEMVRAVVFFEGGMPETAALFCLSVDDAKVAVNLMSGGTGENVAEEWDEYHESASGELLKYVAQALAEHLAVVSGSRVTAAAENVSVLTLGSEREDLETMADANPLAVVTASYVCGAPVISLYLIASGQLVEAIASMARAEAAGEAGGEAGADAGEGAAEEPAPPAESAPPPGPARVPAGGPLLTQEEIAAVLGGLPPEEVGMEAAGVALLAAAAPGTARVSAPLPSGAPEARPVEYEDLGSQRRPAAGLDNLELIKNIPVQLSVELGRTQRTLGEILEFGAGSTIQLDKAADEPVDILAGGRHIATGEVVVVDDNFAVRIRQILRPLHREGREEGQ